MTKISIEKALIASVLSLGVLLSVLPLTQILAGNLQPTAVLTVSPSVGTVFTKFTYDASGSFNNRGSDDGLEYRFNFDTQDLPYTSWSRKKKMTYQYSSPGKKIAAVQVRDKDGQTDKAVIAIDVKDTRVFGAYIKVYPKTGDISTTFRFQALIYNNTDLTLDQYKTRWDFEGDGKWDTEFSDENRVVYHVYPKQGTYTPYLEVKSPFGEKAFIRGYYEPEQENSEINRISVGYGDYPRASLDTYPHTGTAQTTVFTFDASRSYDTEDKNDLLYRFDFEGDGVWDTAFSDDATGYKLYATPGEKNPIVQVKNSRGKTDETSIKITVHDKNHVPDVDFTVKNKESGVNTDSYGTAGTSFHFYAKIKDIEDSLSKMQIRWDFDGDKNWDTQFTKQRNAYHTYLDAGEYDVMLQVLDTDGATSQITKKVKVVANTAPRFVSLKVNPQVGTPGTEFEIDVRGIADDQIRENKVEVRFDFNGDGYYDTDFSTKRRVKHYFRTTGNKVITVQARDKQGLTSIASKEITVISNGAPKANLEVNYVGGLFDTSFKFDASGSYDSEMKDKRKLKFRWDFDYQGENDIHYDSGFTTTAKKNKRFKQTGSRVVKVEVQDEDGEISTAFSTVNIHWASPYIQQMKRKGIARGYKDRTFRANNPVTRAEFLKMILKAKKVKVNRMKYQGMFSDVSKKDWHWKYVEKATEMGFINGYGDGSFKPSQNISRAEAAAMMNRVFDLSVGSVSVSFPDVNRGHWFYNDVMEAKNAGLFSGKDDGKFHPYDSLTRGEASKIIYMAIK